MKNWDVNYTRVIDSMGAGHIIDLEGAHKVLCTGSAGHKTKLKTSSLFWNQLHRNSNKPIVTSLLPKFLIRPSSITTSFTAATFDLDCLQVRSSPWWENFHCISLTMKFFNITILSRYLKKKKKERNVDI